MANKDKNGHWLNGKGQPVDPKYIPAHKKKKDALVEKAFRRLGTIQRSIAKAHDALDGWIAKYTAWLMKVNRLDPSAWEGNLVLTDFAQTRRIQIKQNKIQEMDERIHLAKKLIDECLLEWSDNDNIRAVVTQAFRVDHKGAFNQRLILGLREIEINDAKWRQAMGLIAESLTVTDAKQYILFQEKNARGDWKTIKLDFHG